MSSGFPSEPIGFDIPGGDWGITNEEEIYKGGNSVDKDGFYHVIVDSVADEDAGKEDRLRNINITMEILQGTEVDQIDKKVYHRLYLAKWINSSDHTEGQEPVSKGQMKNIIRFAIAFGLLDKSDIGSDATIPFHALTRRQAIVEVKKEADREGPDKHGNKKTFKGQFRIPFSNVWPLDHEAMAGVPKDATEAARQGIADHGTGFEGDVPDSKLDDI